MLSAIYVTFSLRPNCRQVVQSACHYVQTEQSLIEKQHCEQRAKRRCSEAIAAAAAAVRRYPCNVRFSSARFFSFSMSHHNMFVFLQWGENEHRCCHLRPILFKSCCFPLLAMLLFALPLTTGSTESFLLPALGNHAHSLDLCVTHHGNKCVHSFEDCHDGACLSDFPPHIVRPSNHPPPHCGQEHFCWEWKYKWRYCIRCCFAVSVMNVTPRDHCSCPDHPCLREDAVWHLVACRLDYKLSAWSDFRRFILNFTAQRPLFM